MFTDFHVAQFKLARLAFRVEVLQNGLRKKIGRIVKTSAAGDFDTALSLTREYAGQIRQEREYAKEAAALVKDCLCDAGTGSGSLRRKEVSEYLNIPMDTIRNWEMNGLLTVKRKANGYRVYTDQDISNTAL